jgi:hypothetical protein
MSLQIRRVAPVAALLVALPLVFASCAQKESAPAAGEPKMPFRPTASVQDLMVNVVDASADVLWESVAVISSEKGTEEKQPRTDEEWATVRARAITLMEGANMLMIPGRAVVEPGKKLQDEGTEGNLTAEAIQKLKDEDPMAFASRALALHDSAQAALKAIDAKDAQSLSDVGGAIDEACEQCHTKYWYPNAVGPGAQPAAASAQAAKKS